MQRRAFPVYREISDDTGMRVMNAGLRVMDAGKRG